MVAKYVVVVAVVVVVVPLQVVPGLPHAARLNNGFDAAVADSIHSAGNKR